MAILYQFPINPTSSGGEKNPVGNHFVAMRLLKMSDGSPLTWATLIAAIPGLLALAGALIGYGQIKQRVDELDTELRGEDGVRSRINRIESTLSDVRASTRVLEERTISQGATLINMDKKLDQVLGRLTSH